MSPYSHLTRALLHRSSMVGSSRPARMATLPLALITGGTLSAVVVKVKSAEIPLVATRIARLGARDSDTACSTSTRRASPCDS